MDHHDQELTEKMRGEKHVNDPQTTENFTVQAVTETALDLRLNRFLIFVEIGSKLGYRVEEPNYSQETKQVI